MDDNLSPETNAETQKTTANFFNCYKFIWKISIICLALLILHIPLYMVNQLVKKRAETAEKVRKEICANWADSQIIALRTANSTRAVKEVITALVTPEIRYRGIYQAVVYNSEININAEFKDVKDPNEEVFPEIIDTKGISSIDVTLNGKKVEIDKKTLRFKLPLGDSQCNVKIKLRGSERLSIFANSDNSHIEIAGKWGSPGFAGNALPDERVVEADKFVAKWNFNSFNADSLSHGCVNFCLSAGTYQQSARTFTYATFFLIVFFFTLLVGEIITKTNVHIIQYLVASGAPVLFYLMTVAFSEKVGFATGYMISALTVVIMVTMYCRMFLAKTLPALIIGAVLLISYIINFVILQMEDWALFSGTIVLAIILGVLMILTGKINRQN